MSAIQSSLNLKISDDSGFMAIVNPDRYKSFVDEDWQLTQLFDHFVDEMNSNNLVIWGTDMEYIWTVSFLNQPSEQKAFREFTKSILVTGGQLFLTNYEDLTWLAESATQKLPLKHNADLFIELENGAYNLTVRQMVDPDDFDYDTDGQVDFEIIIEPTTELSPQISKVFWWDN